MLNTLALSCYGGARVDCRCGRVHEISTRSILFGAGVFDKLNEVLAQFVPCSARVLLIFDEVGEVVANDARKLLAGAGFRVVCRAVGDEIDVPEDLLAVVGVGGVLAADAAKVVGAVRDVSVVLVAVAPSCGTYLAPFVFVGDGIPTLKGARAPDALIADTGLVLLEDFELAAGFGELSSKLIALFDGQVSTLVAGEMACPYILEQALALVDSLIEALDVPFLNAQTTAALILEHNIRFSALLQCETAQLLCGGGEAQAAICLDLLLKFEGRKLRASGENRFIAARVLARIYARLLEKMTDLGFVPPPDDNLRAEAAERFLGVPEGEVIKRLIRFSPQKLKICDYRLREFRAELLDTIKHYDKKLARATKIFRRLHSDCGLSLKGYIEKSDLTLSIALAPDYTSNFTMLTQMKNMGVLEGMI